MNKKVNLSFHLFLMNLCENEPSYEGYFHKWL